MTFMMDTFVNLIVSASCHRAGIEFFFFFRKIESRNCNTATVQLVEYAVRSSTEVTKARNEQFLVQNKGLNL